MIKYYVDNEVREKYLKELQEKSKKLNKKSKEFIDNIFFTKDEEDEIYYYGDRALKRYEDKLNKKEKLTLEDVLPKDIYPALDLMMGEELREVLLLASKKIIKFEYTVGYYRRMIRSDNYKNHINNIWNLMEQFVNQYVLGLDIIKILKRDYDYEKYYSILSSEQIFVEIDRKNEKVIEIVKDMLLSENNTNILNYEVFRGIFKSENKELVELTGKLLLAAKLQEGLRQAICETMDCGTQENFEYMFDIIYKNDLLRFSSVKRAISTFTGIGGENSDRITKKQLELIHNVISDKNKADIYLKSDDNVEALIGLWYKGSVSLDELMNSMNEIISKGKRHLILLVSYYLNIIQDNHYSNKVGRSVIKKYAKDEKTFEKNDALEIIACYLHVVVRNINSYNLKNLLNENKLSLDDYFENKKEAKLFFDIFEYAIKTMDAKEKIYSPCIFPWHSVAIKKEELASAMMIIAILVDELKDRAIDYIKMSNSYYRSNFVELLLQKPSNKKQKDMVVELLSDRAGSSSEAYKIIKDNGFADEYISEIENMLKFKTPEIRTNLINLIYEQEEEKLLSSVKNLILQKDINKRLGGLDIVLKCKVEKKCDINSLMEIVNSIKNPSSSEQILLEQICKGKMQDELAKDLYDTKYEVDFDIEFDNDGTKNKKKSKKASENKIIISQTLKISDIFDEPINNLLNVVKKLNNLYTTNENYEYTTYYKVDTMLANGFYPINSEPYRKDISIKNYPLSEVWEDFYKKEIKDFKKLYQLYILINIDSERVNSNLGKEIMSLVGFDMSKLNQEVEKAKLKYFGSRYNERSGYSVISTLYSHYKKENYKYCYEVSRAIMKLIYQNFDAEKFSEKNNDIWRSKESYYTVFNNDIFLSEVFDNFDLFETDEEFKESFTIRYNLYKKYDKFAKMNNSQIDKIFLGLIEYAKAVNIKLIKKDEFYIEVLNRVNTSNWIRSISSYIDGSLPDKNVPGYNSAINDESVKFIKEEGQKIIDYIVELELSRGDTPTEYSNEIHNIRRIEGIDNLIRILKALGNLKLDRSSWYWSGGDAKGATLSHLLKVCYPNSNDTAEKLKKELKKTDITIERLIEVAMYAPQWIDILEKYLDWKGLASGCYYFQAHMSDIDRKKESLFAKYTPISIEDLAVGAFDIDWFNSAYKELGEDNFNMLYESAKYISDGAKHSRARKFADAVLGKFSVADTEIQIEDKRNKDLVASYSLIPLAKNKKRNDDILRRYKFLQKFLKDSKQFGAQRRASEAKAVEIALDNLARNAGFSDVTRLIWTAETDIIKELKEYFSPKRVSDTDVYIKVDKDGKSSIVYEKEKKELKSQPSKLKKDKYIEKLKEVNKSLKDQYSRSKKMLEESMEDGVEFYVYEIDNIIKNNIVVSPLIKDLVFKAGDNLGFYKDKELVSVDNKKLKLKDNDSIKIAHALDLYNSKSWLKYQKYLFDNEIKQSFKQVFRELYIKTEDEIGKDTTLRYAGNQIQPSKTIAVLKGRRWVVDNEEGLQKVYYKQNIIAKIYALADWFSPADIEAPTLEWVEFYDRKTFKKLLIDNIPDLIFTEVMRDVDLAVSVAHVGGVDPQTSHSTIEMRKTIVEFNLPLFNLTNVSFTDKHAVINGSLGEYTVHLGSGLVHQKAGAVINVLPVHSQHRGRLFLPFIDEDPKTAEIMSKIILFAQDEKIKDPSILNQINI